VRQLPGIGRVDEPIHRDLGERGVGDVAVPIDEGQLLALDHLVNQIGRAFAQAAHVQRRQHVQHLQHGRALSIRRQLTHLDTPVVGGDRLDPLRELRGEVPEHKQAALLPEVAGQLFAQPATVHDVRAVTGNGLQRRGQVGLHQAVAGRWGTASWQEDVGRAADPL
jgi:hypothetical protein